jgi:hypothetical protein
MGLFTRPTPRIEAELATVKDELQKARNLLPTAAELSDLEQAAAVLTALAQLLADQSFNRYFQTLAGYSENVHAIAMRQPEASQPGWFGVSVNEHRASLEKDLVQFPGKD